MDNKKRIVLTRDEVKLIMVNLRISQLALKDTISVMDDTDRSLPQFKKMLQDSIVFAELLEVKLNGE